MPKKQWKTKANALQRMADEFEGYGLKGAAKRIREKARILRNHRGRRPKGGR